MSDGLYLHIPFCLSKCVYCDFYSEPGRHDMEAVVDGLLHELSARRSEPGAASPHTIYIGGGTPSLLPPALITRLLAALPISSATEITIEANPDDITPLLVSAWRHAGINRVSLGVQSLNDRHLRAMNRRHDADTALRAIETVLLAGITNVSADLIYALPGLSLPDWTRDVNTLLASGITHLSAYCLTYAEGTPLGRALRDGRVTEAPDEHIADQFAALRRIAADAGFTHYEISNFARPGLQSRHNTTYWKPEGRWLGIGPAAHSFDGHARRANPPSIPRWLALRGRAPEPEAETPLDIINDQLIAALRTAAGYDTRRLPDPLRQRLLANVKPHIDAGDMTLTDSHLAIRPHRWLISNIFMQSALL